MLGVGVLAVAARALGARRGDVVELREVDEFRAGRVARCTVHGPGARDGESVVVKAPDRDDGAFRGLASMHNEHAALTLLGEVGSAAAARLLAADGATGVLVLEDLGDGPSLATALLAGDATAAAEAAVALARALGRLHAETVGSAERYHEIRAGMGPVDREADLFDLRGRDLRSCLADLPEALAQHGLPGLEACRDDLDTVLAELAEPGDLLALSGGDPCPDNGRLGATGFRFFDFEAAAVRHALLDAAHFVVPFPNCWCWRRLPPEVAQRMLDAHREELARSSVQAADGARYRSALSRTTAAWVLWTLDRRLPRAATDPLARTRILEALANFTDAHADANADELPDLRRFCRVVSQRLHERWPSVPETDPYPAFGGPVWAGPV